LIGIVTAPKLDNNAPLSVGFLGDRVVVQNHVIIFRECQSVPVNMWWEGTNLT
jgi:hypothetical protein